MQRQSFGKTGNMGSIGIRKYTACAVQTQKYVAKFKSVGYNGENKPAKGSLTMPFYDLKCRDCGATFNVRATMEEKEKKLIPCPECGSHELERIYETAGIAAITRGVSEPENCKCCANKCCPHARG